MPAYPPCKNPACKSYGRPHPNCRCYGDMAEGGEVTHYCARGEPHQKGCEYFADGGEAGSFDSLIDDNAPSQTASQTPPSFDDLVDDGQKTSLKFDDLQDDQEKYGTTGQQIGAGIEGLAQGVAGPVATLAEKGLSKLGVPGLSDEDIRGRAEANPWTHGAAETAGLVGSTLVPGLGEYNLAKGALKLGAIGADAAKAAELVKAGGFGSKLISGFIASGALQGSDEATKYLLNDPSASAASAMMNIGAAGLFGLGTAGAGIGAQKAATAIQDTNIGDRLRGFVQGLGSHASGNPETVASNLSTVSSNPVAKKGFEAGEAGWKYLGHMVGGGATIGAYEGYHNDGFTGALTGAVKGAGLSYALKKGGEKFLAPILLKAAETGTFNNITGALNHQASVAKGVNALNSGIESLFLKGTHPAFDAAVSEKDRQNLKDYISNGGITQNIQEQIYKDNATQTVPHFAEGGLVNKTPPPKPKEVAPLLDQHPGLAEHFPDQNMIISTARGRVSNYLASLQPQENPSKLAFDTIPKDKQAAKNYNKAIDIALNPLTILQHVKNGTIEPDQIKHLNSMYPEVMTQVQKKLTDRITQAQLKNEKPAYQTRLGMSMMLGTPLDSSMTPASIQAIQAGFAPQQQAQQGPQGGGKGSKKALDKAAGQYRTADESRILNKAKG